MCFGVPAKIVELQEGDQAIVELRGEKRFVDISFVSARLGNWVMIHSGVAFDVIDEQQAFEAFDALDELEIFRHELMVNF